MFFSDVNSISSVTGTLRYGKLPTLNDSVTEKPTKHFHRQVKEMFIIQYCSFSQWYSYSFAVLGKTLFFIFILLGIGETSETYIFDGYIFFYFFMIDNFLCIQSSPTLLLPYLPQVLFFLFATHLFLQVSVSQHLRVWFLMIATTFPNITSTFLSFTSHTPKSDRNMATSSGGTWSVAIISLLTSLRLFMSFLLLKTGRNWTIMCFKSICIMVYF